MNNDQILRQARRRYEECVRVWRENHEAAREDLRFLSGEQWPGDILSERHSSQRPWHSPESIPYLLAISGATSPRLVGEAARLTGGLSALMNRPLGKAAVRGLGAYSAPYLIDPFRQ